jgi:hypothetical protein
MAQRIIPFRGYATTNDGSTPEEFSLVEEGTETAITLGEGDILHVHMVSVSSGSGITNAFFSDDGVDDVETRRIVTGQGRIVLNFPRPVVGPAGFALYASSSGANRVDATAVGFVERTS